MGQRAIIAAASAAAAAAVFSTAAAGAARVSTATPKVLLIFLNCLPLEGSLWAHYGDEFAGLRGAESISLMQEV